MSCEFETGSLTKSQKPVRSPEIRPEYRTMSCEFKALARMVREEFGKQPDTTEESTIGNSCGVKSGVLFERGRLYDEYSARRNERLKRKKGVMVDREVNTAVKPKVSHRSLGVTVESGKKSASRKLGSLRKSVSAAYSTEVSETPRYMLRSMTKENKKPPLASRFDNKLGTVGEKKIGAPRRGGRITYY